MEDGVCYRNPAWKWVKLVEEEELGEILFSCCTISTLSAMSSHCTNLFTARDDIFPAMQ